MRKSAANPKENGFENDFDLMEIALRMLYQGYEQTKDRWLDLGLMPYADITSSAEA